MLRLKDKLKNWEELNKFSNSTKAIVSAFVLTFSPKITSVFEFFNIQLSLNFKLTVLSGICFFIAGTLTKLFAPATIKEHSDKATLQRTIVELQENLAKTDAAKVELAASQLKNWLKNRLPEHSLEKEEIKKCIDEGISKSINPDLKRLHADLTNWDQISKQDSPVFLNITNLFFYVGGVLSAVWALRQLWSILKSF